MSTMRFCLTNRNTTHWWHKHTAVSDPKVHLCILQMVFSNLKVKLLSNLITKVFILKVHAFHGNWTHDLAVVRTMLFCLSYKKDTNFDDTEIQQFQKNTFMQFLNCFLATYIIIMQEFIGNWTHNLSVFSAILFCSNYRNAAYVDRTNGAQFRKQN